MQINRRTVLWGIIVILFVATLFLSFNAGSGNAAVGATGQVADIAKSAASSAMVGGC